MQNYARANKIIITTISTSTR